MEKLRGIGVSSGIAIGKALVWKTLPATFSEYRIDKNKVAEEIIRFENALVETEREILKVQRKIHVNAGAQYGEIFDIHLALLKDKFLRENTINLIQTEQINSESALDKVIKNLAILFQKTPDDFLRGRRKDLLDVVEKLISNLKGSPKGKIKKFVKKGIIIGETLSPSQTAAIDTSYITGFATDIGSKTSHTAIVAQALKIPAVVGLGKITKITEDEDTIIIDGIDGIVIINPTQLVLKKYQKKREKYIELRKQLQLLQKVASITKDGKEIKLGANISFPEEVNSIRKYGGEEIGLYRTEYLYLNRKDLPSEEEQFQAYKKVAETMGNNSAIIIRTLDIGGDKFASTINFPQELNPFLGWRGIRFCLERKDIFETQLKAIYRAAKYGNLKVMFPMLSTLEEILDAKNFLSEVKRKLKKEEKEFKDVEIGIMIEVPSAAVISERLAEEVNFFSIGTNDLIQYTIAVDRINEKIAHLYQPCHPAVLRLIQHIIESGHKKKICVGICGEMASIPEIACLLVGMGIDTLSMAPISIPEVKKIIRKISYSKMEKIVEKVLQFNTHKEIWDYLKKSLAEKN